MNGFYGQALTAGEEWPQREVVSLVRSIDYQHQEASDEFTFTQPTWGGQKQATFVRGDRAWDVAFVPPGMLYVVSGISKDTEITPQLPEAQRRQLDILMTPHGFIRAASAAGSVAKLTSIRDSVTTVSFTVFGKYRLTGTLVHNLVTRVATQVPDPVLGDTDLTATYSGYKSFGAFRAPTHIVQSQGGYPIWVINVTHVDEPGVNLTVPHSVATATVPEVYVKSTLLAPGVWYFTGGITYSAAVEFPHYIVVLEAPTDEAHSLAVIAQIHKLMPSKPIRYIVTTHHAFDHIGGLRTYVAEGATVVTHISNVKFLSKSLVAPATIEPDLQSVARKKPTFVPVKDKWVLKEGNQEIQVYNTIGDDHTNELLIAYMPKSGILFEADSFSPAPMSATMPYKSNPYPPPPNALVLWDNIQRLKLKVRIIAPTHGSGAVPWAEFAAFVRK